MDITFLDIERAWRDKSPDLAEMFCALASMQEKAPASRPNALTWHTIQNTHRSYAFRKQSDEQKRQRRLADWRALESADAESPLPDRYKLHDILLALWRDGSAYGRGQLLRICAVTPLRHGPWRGFKQIFKEAEASSDWEIYGALAARLDVEYASGRTYRDVDTVTLRYLVLRAWRVLRTLGHRLPGAYPDAAAAVLRGYPESARFEKTWIANHIFFHEDRGYGRHAFKRTHYRASSPVILHRAFAESWRRSPRPLFSLLEGASSDAVRSFAADSLKTNFRTQLRESEPAWVVRLIEVGSRCVDDFVVWLLDNVPQFEPSSFRALGLHEAVLRLLVSREPKAAAWAASYVRVHARDLPLRSSALTPSPSAIDLLSLVNSPHLAVRDLARDLIQALDPRTAVGLSAWGELLGSGYGHALAVRALQEHFSSNELTLDWFHGRLLSDNYTVATFASGLLAKIHPESAIPLSFWASLLDNPKGVHLGTTALDALQSRAQRGESLDALEPDILRRALLQRKSRARVQSWVHEGRVAAATFGVGWLQALAYHRTWDDDPWVAALLRSDLAWTDGLTFDEELSVWALELLRDERNFDGHTLGFAWLYDMLERTTPRYHRFATQILTRDFPPEDFCPKDAQVAASERPMAGALRLWALATEPGPANDPLRRFALHYLRLHHRDIYLAKTEETLDEGAALPVDFFTFERARALCADERAALRELGLLWLAWDLARLSPPMSEIAALCEIPYPEVRAFVTLALTAEDTLAHQRYRIDPSTLTVEGVYRFCESLDPGTRALGMRLIARHERLMVAEELFRLAESPDRIVRAFVIRQLWRMYRDSGATQSFSPPPSSDRAVTPRVRPAHWPASVQQLRVFLRRTLFGVPAARSNRAAANRAAANRAAANRAAANRAAAANGAAAADDVGARPLSSARAKVSLIEICRDLAVEDERFADLVRPIFEEFIASRSKSESMACLVALTRIGHRWGSQ